MEFFRYTDTNPLIFTNISFWLFFAVLLVGYSLVYKRQTARSVYLLIFSLFFYYKTSGPFCILLLFSIAAGYAITLQIPRCRSQRGKKWLLAVNVSLCLLLLSYFKYTYLVVDALNAIWGANIQVTNHLALFANMLGGHFDASQILLPVGISFYLFQSISYTVDVYRQKLAPTRNFVDFALYVSFFPQLVAGPIVRAAEFMPQTTSDYHLTRREFGHAIFLILTGLLKKMVVSDYISINMVDRVFDNPLLHSGLENLLAIYGYALQIYCDFSGYTDIAIGLALLLGFRLCTNFNSPYKAMNISDFWRRWHISLSSWLRDYLYIPLGGNRHGRIRTAVNLMITMLLGGLWHGANLRFILWGGIHGMALVAHKGLAKSRWATVMSGPWGRRLGVVLTFHLVCFAWIFFRADSITSAGLMLEQIATHFGGASIPDIVQAHLPVLAIMLCGYVAHWLPNSLQETIRGRFIDTPVVLKLLIVLLSVLLIVQTSTTGLQPFIYFKF